VTLCAEAGRLHLEVTAEVPVEDHALDPTRSAGVDIGIIHPFAVAAGDEGMLVSGRALRAEERLHLSATKPASASCLPGNLVGANGAPGAGASSGLPNERPRPVIGPGSATPTTMRPRR
jgi:hypothetical protein